MQAQRQSNDASAGPHLTTAGNFKVGMKLEAKDRQYPTLTCVATVQEINNGKLLIHFDGWTSSYDYWCSSDSTDIHPMGWCKRHGRELQAPKGETNCLLVLSVTELYRCTCVMNCLIGTALSNRISPGQYSVVTVCMFHCTV